MDENVPPSNFENQPPLLRPPPVASYPPPPLAPPPPIMAAVQPPRRRGKGWLWCSLFLLIALGFSVFHSCSVVPGKTLHNREHLLQEVVTENNGSDNKIAVIDVGGIISSASLDGGRNMVEFIADQLKTAGHDKDVKAVILKVNSPGGEVLASDEIYNAIERFQTDFHKPVISSMETLAASGGYYISAPCQWIVANEMTITGSIGVIMHGYNYRGLMDKVGIKPEVFKSGKFKDMMSGEKLENEVSAEEKSMVQDMIMETYGRFTNIVAHGRETAASRNHGKGRTLAPDWTSYADGRILSGNQAYKLGFVDQIGNFETSVKTARTLANVEDANLIQYEQPFNVGSLFHLLGESTKSKPTMKIDFGINFPLLQKGQLYFIAPTSLP